MTDHPLTKEELRHFTGSENWYRHGLNRTMLYTDGVQHLAERAGAYWLIDEIALAQLIPSIASQAFQVWQLDVRADRTASLSCTDGNCLPVHAKDITFTDFPLESIRLYVTNRTILLPSEY